jgi:glycosyltransferase involved in cell wall biosynthesis
LSFRIFVPRLMDANNNNAQNSNAQAMLRAWSAMDTRVRTLTYGTPDSEVASNPSIEITRLWRWRAWIVHLFICYFRPCDAIFYPGAEAADFAALRWRRWSGQSVPVIATLEGLVGDRQREVEYSRIAGHPVYCQLVSAKVLERLDALYREANHIIAISPFLARMGATRYGDKFSVLPLGVDSATFYPPANRAAGPAPLVVSAGRVASHKRPRVFLELAQCFPDARFKWFGEGSDRPSLLTEASARGLTNVDFPGAKHPAELAEEFRKADIFILPSHSEGAPKVIQEAQACGLPVIAFGFYEPPTLIDSQTGFLVWTDAQLAARLGQLIEHTSLRYAFGAKTRELTLGWDWDRVGPLWERHMMKLIHRENG